MSTAQAIHGSSFVVSKMIKKIIIILPIGFLISLAFGVGVSDREVLAILTNFSPGYFALAMLLILLPWFVNTLRLFIWTRFLGTKLTFIQTFRIMLISEFGAAITPSAVGSAPVKTGLLIQEKMTSGAALSLATITTLEDLAFFIIAVPTALTLSAAWHLSFLKIFYEKLHTNLIWLIASIIIIGLLIWFAIIKISKNYTPQPDDRLNYRPSFIQRMTSKARKILKDFQSTYVVIGKRGKLRFMMTSTLTGIQWICRYSIITALAASLALNVDPVLFFALQWVVSTLTVFIPTPGASGGAEAGFYLIFAPFLPHSSLGLLTAGWRFLAFYSYLGIGVMVYFLLNLVETAIQKNFGETKLVLVE